MKIKTTKTNRVNLSVQLISGVTVKFDEHLVGEIDEEYFDAICERDSSISAVEIDEEAEFEQEVAKAKAKKEKVKKAKSKSKAEEAKIEAEEAKIEAEKQDTSTDEQTPIDSLTVAELQALCEEAGKDKKDWGSLKKAELVVYVANSI